MTIPFLAVVSGLTLLVWSADRFVEGAAVVARYLGMPPLLIGMVIVGFGTSAPELAVSALAAYQGNPGISLGNAYGSNISNIALILGATALISPITIHAQVLKREFPILILVTLLAAYQASDGLLSFWDASILLLIFAFLMGRTILQGLRYRNGMMQRGEHLDNSGLMPFEKALAYLIIGLILLIVSSRILIWGAVEIAVAFGVSDLVIGLTIVALGTSLPELASSAMASRKGEHDIALGNVVGSNLFNTLAAVGLAGIIHPMTISPEVLSRDILVMGALTVFLFFIGLGMGGKGRINRLEGAMLLACYFFYTGYILVNAFTTA